MPDPQQTPAPQAGAARTWRRYLRFWRPRPEADVDDELRFHFEMRVRDHMARGLSEPDARAAVIHRLGNLDDARAECVSITSRRERGMKRALTIDALLQDLRFTLRSIGRQKGWTFVAILTLALGIGANTAVFSVVNSLVLHPLPYPGADRLALVFMQPTTANTSGVTVTVSPSPMQVKAWVEGSRSFESLQPFHSSNVTLETRGEAPASVHAAAILPTFPQFAGHRPVIGRMFTAAEVAAREPVLLLSEGTWRARFGADPAVLGTTVTIADKLHTIVGVLPGSLHVPKLSRPVTDIWLPLQITPDRFSISLVGRLRPGVTYEAAMRELDTLSSRVDATRGIGRFRSSVVSPREMVHFKQSLILLSAVVVLVLLIACTNVAHLLLARAATRQRELAIRTALGAGKGRLFRQLLTESLLLAGAGCVGGLAVGWLGLRALVAMRPESLSDLGAATMNGTVLLVTVALSVATGIGFGLFAAVQSSRHSTHESLKAGALNTSQARQHHRMRSLLVVTEMALSTTLLVGAALLVRSVMHLQMTDPGFDPAGVYAVTPGLPESRYKEDAAKKAFFVQLADRARTVPGVTAVTVANSAPPAYSFLIGALQLEGEPEPPKGTTGFIRHNAVSPGFFRTMGMRVVQGTTFTDSLRGGGQLMVNEGFAAKHWPGKTAVGQRIRIIGFDGKGTWSTVVGVVGDAALGGLTDDRSDPILYFPEADYYSPEIILRTTPGADALPAIRSLVSSLDPRLPPPDIRNLADEMANSASAPRFTMLLLVSFTALALILAAVGLYGVMAYGVAQRTREIGIRIALGATRQTIARAVVSNGVALALVGSAFGLVGAWWATKLVEKMLYGVTRTDPISFIAGALVLVMTAAIACIVPMNRAASVDPLIAMKAD